MIFFWHGLRSPFNHSSKILENEKSSSVLAVENCGQPPVATVQWAFAVLCCCYQVWLQMSTDSNLVIRSSECLSVLFLEAVSLATNSYLHILSDYISYQFFSLNGLFMSYSTALGFLMKNTDVVFDTIVQTYGLNLECLSVILM